MPGGAAADKKVAKKESQKPTWPFESIVDEVAKENSSPAALLINEEVGLLKNQLCPICDGFGHSMADCATNSKLENFRQVPATGAVLAALRKLSRQMDPDHRTEKLSMLRPRPSKVSRKKLGAASTANTAPTIGDND